ncbi:hypothetical protein IC607_01115 [Cellulomonas sp. JH27-2]|nr:hypothetical protein [Cellulomonas sp. JH27-2]MBD8057569.1 hypothetical protein [Cellulomonas sp. JH27-2]
MVDDPCSDEALRDEIRANRRDEWRVLVAAVIAGAVTAVVLVLRSLVA